MLASLALANATTIIGFGILGFASVPVLNAIGMTVGPGALLCLAFAAMLSRRQAGHDAVSRAPARPPEERASLRRWAPSRALRVSFWLHVAAAAALAGVGLHAFVDRRDCRHGRRRSSRWRWRRFVLDHVALTLAGLCPRCSLLGPNITRLPEAARRRGLVAITLDDGPDPQVTPLVLDLLRDAGATASFFLIGRKAEQHPALVARIVAEGHSVENHSWAHSHSFAFSGPARFRAEIGRAQQSLGAAGGRAAAVLSRAGRACAIRCSSRCSAASDCP